MPKTYPPISYGQVSNPSQLNEIYQDVSVLTAQVFNVKESTFGAVGDGTTNDTVAIQAALDAAAISGGMVVFPPGTYAITASLTASDHVAVTGAGMSATVLRVPAGATFPAIEVNSRTNVKVRGLSIVKAAGAAVSSRGYGVWIHGNASDVLIEDVLNDALVSGVTTGYGSTGASDGTCQRITLRNVTALNSPSLWGISLDDVDKVTLDNCSARGNWLDGLKLRKKALNVTIQGGSFTGNGVFGAGDGMDAYAGGDTFVVDGTIFEGNTGNGCTIKTGDLNQTDAANFGYVKNVQLIGLRCRNNTGIGCYLTVSDPVDLAEPLVSAVSVQGGLFEGNGTGAAGDGLYIAARNVTVNGAIAKKNRRHGFLVTSRAIDTHFIGCIAIANSQNAAGSFNGFDIAGVRGSVVGCLAMGADADTVAVDGDYAALTKMQQFGVIINSTAIGPWYVGGGTRSINHSASGNGLRTDMTSGIVRIDQTTAGNPGVQAAYGSIGGLTVNTSAATEADVLWVKASGNPNASTVGHRRLLPLTATATLDFASIAAQTCGTLTITVTGAATGDTVQLGPPAALEAGLSATGYVSATNTVTVRLCNVTVAAIDPASATWRATVVKA